MDPKDELDLQPDFEGPMECDECLGLYAPEATYCCPDCNKTVCEWCWEKHYTDHINKELKNETT